MLDKQDKQEYLENFKKRIQAIDSILLLKDFRSAVAMNAIKTFKFDLDKELQIKIAIMARELEKRLERRVKIEQSPKKDIS